MAPNIPHKVAILLCTYNGERYLDEQLNSVLNQTHTNWRIYASDDGSNDETLRILEKFQEKVGTDRIIIINGPRNGPTSNFLSLISRVDGDYEYFAFCDQDDVWHEEKLFRAVKLLIGVENQVPAVYCSSTRYIASNGRFLQCSYVFKGKPSFKNALVQCIAGGNTMVFNKMAKNILSKTPKFQMLVAHDWWLYILITAYGGYVHYDKAPSVDYRQHSNALVGENRSINSKIKRILMLLDGRYKKWTNLNITALDAISHELPLHSKQTLDFFKKIKRSSFFTRVFIFIYSGIRRQTFMGNIALAIAVLIKRF